MLKVIIGGWVVYFFCNTRVHEKVQMKNIVVSVTVHKRLTRVIVTDCRYECHELCTQQCTIVTYNRLHCTKTRHSD